MAVFVSYSSPDKEAVDNIVRALTTAREQFGSTRNSPAAKRRRRSSNRFAKATC